MDMQHLITVLINKVNQTRQVLTHCALCGSNDLHRGMAANQKNPSQTIICQYCLQDLPLFNLADLGGDLLHWPAINNLIKQRTFDHLICLSPHQTPYTKWIRQFKYKGAFELEQLLSSLLINQYKILLNQRLLTEPDCIIPVPLHIKKWQKRGFNQSALLAKNLANALGINYQNSLVLRNKYTEQQVGMTGAERRKNLRNAFNINWPNKKLPEHIMIIDDVVTTGSTVNEMSQLLKEVGVTKVTVFALCLSLPL